MNILTNVELLLYATLLFTPPLLVAALGCCFSTTSGIVNIGLDGLMTVGAFVGCASTYFLQNSALGLLFAGIISAIFSIIFAIFVLKFHTDEILVGFVLNIFLPALVVIVSYSLFNSTDTPALPADLKIPIPLTAAIALILVVISSFIIKKTNIGLYIRACGSNKRAALYVGINREKLQFFCILLSGFLCGIGGAFITMAVTNQFRTASITGQGYVALAAVLFGNANPYAIMICCIIFGFFSGLKIIIPANSAIVHLIQTLPYIATIIILIIHYGRNKKTSKK